MPDANFRILAGILSRPVDLLACNCLASLPANTKRCGDVARWSYFSQVGPDIMATFSRCWFKDLTKCNDVTTS